MKSIIKNINDIALEGTHYLPNSRKTLVNSKEVTTKNLDALTKGFLAKSKVWDWHSHENHDELCIVITGSGKFQTDDETVSYKPEDVIIIPAKLRHKIEALEDCEFYFVRIKV